MIMEEERRKDNVRTFLIGNTKRRKRREALLVMCDR